MTAISSNYLSFASAAEACVAEDLGETGVADILLKTSIHRDPKPWAALWTTAHRWEKKNARNDSATWSKTGAHLHLSTISLSITAGQCRRGWHAVSWQMSRLVLPAPRLMLYALADTDARHHGNLNHLQISPETHLTRPFFFTTTTTTTTVQIKPNYTLLLFLSDNKGGRWG